MKIDLPAEPKPEHVSVVYDHREEPSQLDVSPLRMVRGTLDVGDYVLEAMPRYACIERKTATDFLACCGRERKRLDSQLERLKQFPARLLLVEMSWQMIEAGEWRDDVSPESARGTLLGAMEMGVPVMLLPSRELAGTYAARWLFIAARRRWRELYGFAKGLKEPST
ncbi:MAG: ERCC4 domain-containing protein [Pirellulaceae bacterium]